MAPFPLRAKHSISRGVPAGQLIGGYVTSSSAWNVNAPTSDACATRSGCADAAGTTIATAIAPARPMLLIVVPRSLTRGTEKPMTFRLWSRVRRSSNRGLQLSEHRSLRETRNEPAGFAGGLLAGPA